MPSRVPTLRPAGAADARQSYERLPSRQADKDFYCSAAWLRLRDLVRAEEPLCRGCLASGRVEPTAAIDHVVDRKERPDLALDRDNLQGLCKRHHNQKRRAT